MDLLLAGGFLSIGIGTFAFAVGPVLSGSELGLGPTAIWAAIGAGLFGAALIAFAPFVSRRTGKRRRALAVTVVLVVMSLFAIWLERSLSRPRPRAVERGRNPLAGHRRGIRASRPALARRGRRLRSSLPPPRSRPRQLAHARADAGRLRRPPLRARSAALERLRPAERRPAPVRLRRPPRRRLARDRPGRVRARRRRGAGARGARDPRRPRPVPLRDLGPDQHARVGRRPGDDPASAQVRIDRGPAGGAVRGARALLRPPARRRSTRRCGATSTSWSPTASSTSRWRSTRRWRSAPTRRSRSSGSSRRASRTCASTPAHATPSSRSPSATGGASSASRMTAPGS